MDFRCHFCRELHTVEGGDVEDGGLRFRCARCDTRHTIRDGRIQRVTVPEVRLDENSQERDTIPGIDEDTFAPVQASTADDADDAPTLRMEPVRPKRWLGRETWASALVVTVGLGVVGYAAAGPPPRPQRALASGASFVTLMRAAPPETPAVTPAPPPSVSPTAQPTSQARVHPPRTRRGR